MKRILSPFVWLGLVSILALGLSASVAVAQEVDPALALAPLGSGFTYQGELRDAGDPVTSSCDFQFKLWDSENAGGGGKSAVHRQSAM